MTGYQSKKAAARDKLDGMDREALKLALEALQFSGNIWHMDCKKDEAIAAIKEALAQPAQEPTLQEQLAIAQADLDKANAVWDKSYAAREKADAAWDKANKNLGKAGAEINRIKKLMEQQNG